MPNQNVSTKISREIITLYDRFTHGEMDRRAFMERLAGLAGSTAAAVALLPMLQNNYAQANTVAPDDARLSISENTTIAGADAGLAGYLAAPKGTVKRPALVVIHENRGLNAHIKDVTRRAALEGYLSLGIDVLSPDGGTPADEDKAREMIGKVPPEVAEKRIAAAVQLLMKHPLSTGKVGAIGFCWGGSNVNRLAAIEPNLVAGVAYYGGQIPAERVGSIKAALMLHYAGLDQRINAGIPAYKAALEAAGKSFEIHMYENVDHAFNNDTNAARYNADAAKLAWQRSFAFLAKHLGTPPKVG